MMTSTAPHRDVGGADQRAEGRGQAPGEKVVINGAGAAAIAIARLMLSYGFKSLLLCDRRGLIWPGRPEGMNAVKEEIAALTNPGKQQGSLSDALHGADVFIGVSAPGTVTADMVRSMARTPWCLPANPVRDRTRMTRSRARHRGSAIPNQINNVPFPAFRARRHACAGHQRRDEGSRRRHLAAMISRTICRPTDHPR